MLIHCYSSLVLADYVLITFAASDHEHACCRRAAEEAYARWRSNGANGKENSAVKPHRMAIIKDDSADAKGYKEVDVKKFKVILVIVTSRNGLEPCLPFRRYHAILQNTTSGERFRAVLNARQFSQVVATLFCAP